MRSGLQALIAPVVVLGGLLLLAEEARSSNKRPTDAERGAELYQRHCVQCHGAQADGNGPASAALVHQVPDLRGKVKVDDDAAELVLRGRKAMPGFLASFDKADARRVLRHMRTLGEPDDPQDQGE